MLVVVVRTWKWLAHEKIFFTELGPQTMFFWFRKIRNASKKKNQLHTLIFFFDDTVPLIVNNEWKWTQNGFHSSVLTKPFYHIKYTSAELECPFNTYPRQNPSPMHAVCATVCVASPSNTELALAASERPWKAVRTRRRTESQFLKRSSPRQNWSPKRPTKNTRR